MTSWKNLLVRRSPSPSHVDDVNPGLFHDAKDQDECFRFAKCVPTGTFLVKAANEDEPIIIHSFFSERDVQKSFVLRGGLDDQTEVKLFSFDREEMFVTKDMSKYRLDQSSAAHDRVAAGEGQVALRSCQFVPLKLAQLLISNKGQQASSLNDLLTVTTTFLQDQSLNGTQIYAPENGSMVFQWLMNFNSDDMTPVTLMQEDSLQNKEQILSNLRLFRLNQNLFESVFREIPDEDEIAGSKALGHFAKERSEKSSILTEFMAQLDKCNYHLECVDNDEYSVFLQKIKNAKVNFKIHHIPELSEPEEEVVGISVNDGGMEDTHDGADEADETKANHSNDEAEEGKETIEEPTNTPSSWSWPKLNEIESDEIRVTFANTISSESDAMADGMFFVKLPCDIPLAHKLDPTASGIFIRNEDIGLIYACDTARIKRSVVLGNPGISKSWLLWKYVVIAANNDVWKILNQHKKFDLSNETVIDFPGVIIYVMSNETLDVMFLEDGIVLTFDFFNSKKVIELLNKAAMKQEREGTNVRIQMLYEPYASKQNIPLPRMCKDIECIAAVSPSEERYHDFLNQMDANKFIMQCPSEKELEAIIRFFAWLRRDDTDALEKQLTTFRKRYSEVGPFLRDLIKNDGRYQQLQQAIKNYVLNFPANNILCLLNKFESEDTHEMSYKLGRCVTPEAFSGNFTKYVIKPTSPHVIRRINNILKQSDLEDIRKKVLTFQTGVGSEFQNAKLLEHLVAQYITSDNGLRWKACTCNVSATTGKKHDSLSNIKAVVDLEEAKFNSNTEDERGEPKAADMVPGVLYRPSNPNYPFVDMLFIGKTNGPILAIQCTVSKKHCKGSGVYEKLRKSLGISGTDRKLIVYMVTIPRSVESYLTGKISTFISESSKKRKMNDDDEPSPIVMPKNLEFRVCIPDILMKNKAPDTSFFQKYHLCFA